MSTNPLCLSSNYLSAPLTVQTESEDLWLGENHAKLRTGQCIENKETKYSILLKSSGLFNMLGSQNTGSQDYTLQARDCRILLWVICPTKIKKKKN